MSAPPPAANQPPPQSPDNEAGTAALASEHEAAPSAGADTQVCPSATDQDTPNQDTPSPDEDTPAQTRKKALGIALVFAVLLVASVIVIIIFPPSGGIPTAKKARVADFNLVISTQLITPGEGSLAPLRYAPKSASTRYRLELQQTIQYPNATPLQAKLSATLNFSPDRKASPSEFRTLMHITDVDVDVHDDDRILELASAGRMLEGITLEFRLDPQLGIGKALPLTKANPQVTRILYIVSDLMRQTWPALPEQPIGDAAQWTITNDTLQSQGFATTTTITRKGDALRAESKQTKHPTKESPARIEATAQVDSTLTHGQIIQATGTFDSRIHDGGDTPILQKTTFSLTHIPET